VDVAVGIAQIVLAGVALGVGWKALRISQEVQREADDQRKRSEDYDLLMQLQTLLNAVPTIQDGVSNRSRFEDRQRWMLTLLAASGLRNELPETRALAEFPFDGVWDELVELAECARLEIHGMLEQAGDRAYARRHLGT
jgi:type II secretory pathway component PulF